jgi:alpha-galactosidase
MSVEYCRDMASCGSWISGLADLWRTTGDIQANFDSMMANLDGNNEVAGAHRPGKFCDPDMLIVADSGVSREEAKVQLSGWAIAAAPMLISFDLTQIDPSSPGPAIADLTNPELIAVSQDAAQIQGVRVSPAAPFGAECWARALGPSGLWAGVRETRAVAALLVNRAPIGAASVNISCSWEQLGVPAGVSASVRDIFERADLPNATDSVFFDVAPHTGRFVRLSW